MSFGLIFVKKRHFSIFHEIILISIQFQFNSFIFPLSIVHIYNDGTF